MQAAGVRTDSELSRALGITPQSVRPVRVREQVPASWVEKIAETSGISSDWIFFGRGPMRPGEETSPIVYQTGPDDSDVVWIPMVSAVLSAGLGSLETNADCERKYAFQLDFITRKGSAKNMVIMRVAGDSMAPEILHNDVVLIDQSKTAFSAGHIFAVGFEEGIYMKRLDFLPGKIILKSANPAYPPVELDARGQLSDHFRIIGRVLWSGREYL